MCVSTRQDNVSVFRLFLGDESADFVDIDIRVSDGNVDLVEQHHSDIRVAYQIFRDSPCVLSHFNVAGLVLGFPSETGAHSMESAYVAEFGGDQFAFACGHAALDELDDRTAYAVRNASENHSECSGRFAFAFAGVDDDQPFFFGLCGHDLVADHFLLGHLDFVSFQIVSHHLSCLRHVAPRRTAFRASGESNSNAGAKDRAPTPPAAWPPFL